jgi:hypothetical protein
MKQITEDEWIAEFEPRLNPADPDGEDGSWGGCLYEPEDISRLGPSPAHTWTLLDCDGQMVIASGWHWVNRMGYFVTRKPWTEDTEILVDGVEDEQ